MKFRFSKFGKHKPNENLNTVEDYANLKPLPTSHHIMLMMMNEDDTQVSSGIKENPFMLQA